MLTADVVIFVVVFPDRIGHSTNINTRNVVTESLVTYTLTFFPYLAIVAVLLTIAICFERVHILKHLFCNFYQRFRPYRFTHSTPSPKKKYKNVITVRALNIRSIGHLPSVLDAVYVCQRHSQNTNEIGHNTNILIQLLPPPLL